MMQTVAEPKRLKLPVTCRLAVTLTNSREHADQFCPCQRLPKSIIEVQKGPKGALSLDFQRARLEIKQ